MFAFFWFSKSFIEFPFSIGNGLHDSEQLLDKQKLAAPVKSAVDKFQLLPEFLKVLKILCIFNFWIYSYYEVR